MDGLGNTRRMFQNWSYEWQTLGQLVSLGQVETMVSRELLVLEAILDCDDCWEAFEALSEPITTYRLASTVALSGLFCMMIAPTALALPSGYQSVAGDVKFAQHGNTLNISTQANRSVVNYQHFDIGAGETVNIMMPGAHSAMLNRVTGGDPSQIFGNLNSNGQVFLTNPSGILFGKGAEVNVGSLFATTHTISDSQFLAGQYSFSRDSNAKPSSVTNQGTIQVQSGGYAVLAGSAVDNQGAISAPLGQVHLVVGEKVTMAVDNNLAVEVTVNQGLKQKVDGVQSAISNTGSISADGGVVHMQANLNHGLYQEAVNNQGLVEAKSFDMLNGEVMLSANADSGAVVQNSGTVDVSAATATANGGTIHIEGDDVLQEGILKADGSAQTGLGGTVEVLGNQVALSHGASISATGGSGGGTILVGGNFHGQGPQRTAQNTLIEQGVTLDADALVKGNGGHIAVWADDNTAYYGTLSTRGGSESGNGGFAEVSGKQNLDFRGQADLSAQQGHQGTLLLDPLNIIVSNASAAAYADVSSFAAQAGTTQTVSPATLNAVAGDVVLEATNDITFNAGSNLTLNTAGASLTASAGHNITVNANIATTGSGNITMTANNNVTVGGTITTAGGDISLTAGGPVNGAPANNVGIMNVNSAITSNNGDISLSGSQMKINNTVNAGSGSITLAPTTAKAIQVATGADTNSNAVFDVSTPMLTNDLIASVVNIGSTGLAGGLTVKGNLDVSGIAGQAGVYTLNLLNGGNIASTNFTFTQGSNAINVTSLGAVNINTTGATKSLHLGTVTAGTNLALFTTGTDSSITTTGDVTANNGYLNVYTSGTGAGSISLGGNVSATGVDATSGPQGFRFSLDSYNSNLSVAGNVTDNTSYTPGHSGTSVIAAGYNGTGTLNNSASTLALGGSLSITGDANKTLRVFSGASPVSLGNNLSLAALDIRTAGAHADATVGDNLTTTSSVSIKTTGLDSDITTGLITAGTSLMLSTTGTDSSITTTGDVTASNGFLNIYTTGAGAGSITIGGNVSGTGTDLGSGPQGYRFSLDSYNGNVSVAGNITDNTSYTLGHSGTSVIAAGYTGNGTLNDPTSTLSVGGSINITNDGNKTLNVYAGSSPVTLGTNLSLSALDIRTSGNNADVTVGNNLTTTNGVSMVTNGVGSAIHTGSITTGTTLFLTSYGSNSNITTGSVTAGTSLWMATYGLNSKITTSDLTASNGYLNLFTFGQGSSTLTVNGDVSAFGADIAGVFNDLQLAVDSYYSNVTVTGTVNNNYAFTPGHTGKMLLAAGYNSDKVLLHPGSQLFLGHPVNIVDSVDQTVSILQAPPAPVIFTGPSDSGGGSVGVTWLGNASSDNPLSRREESIITKTPAPPPSDVEGLTF